MKNLVRLAAGTLAGAGLLFAQQPVLRQYTVATMPAASANSGIAIVVKDGASATDCSVGSGAFAVVCKSNGTTWTAQSIGSGGGNVSTTSMTTGALVTASGASAIQTPNASASMDSSGNVSTPGSVTAASYSTNVATPGALNLLAGTGSIASLPANAAGFAAPATGGTSYLFKLPGTASAGLLFAATPALGDGVNESALSFKSLQGTDSNILTSGTISGTAASLCTDANGGATTSGCPSYLTGNQTITLSGDVTGSGATAITTTTAKINGTSIPTNSAADQAIVTTAAATGSWASLPTCVDSGGQHLNYNTTTHTFSCGTTGGTAGSAAFNTITGGTNTQAAMLVGTGASLGPTGTGTVNANQINGASAPTSANLVGTNGSGQIIANNTSYLTGNQTITLTGDTTGSGATSIATTTTKVNGGAIPTSAPLLSSNSSNQITSTTFSAVSPITTLGDILYGSAANTTSRLAGYTAANAAVLTQTGTGTVSAAPAWSNAPALSAANMTGFPTLNQNTTGNAATATSATTATNIAGGAVGSVPYQSGAGATALLSGNTAATDQVVVSHGTGSVAQAPTLSNAPALSAANMTSFPTLNQNTTGTSAGFTGSLAGDVTGTQSATVVGKINGGSMPASATVLGSNSSSQPVAISISNNTVLGNNSGIIAAPTALTATNLDALLGTVPATSSTFGVVKVDGTTITASGGVISAVSGGSGNMALTSGAGAPSGSCTAGTSWYLDTTNQDDWFCSSTNTWKKNVSTSNSGPFVATGQTSSSNPTTPASGSASLFFNTSSVAQTENSAGSISGTQVAPATGATSNQWVSYVDSSGTQHTSQPAFTNISGTVGAAQLPNPSSSTLGGIESYSAVSHQWINAISTSGVPSSTQPAAADLSNGTVGTGAVVLSSSNATTVNGVSCALAGTCTVPLISSVAAHTTSYTLTSSDQGSLVVMNCSAACTVTLYGSPANGYFAGIESIGSTLATVSLNSKTFNGSASVPVLNSYSIWQFYSDGTNYYGEAPLAAGSGASLGPNSNALTISATGTGGGITGPGTTTNGNIVTWNSTNGTTVGSGLAAPAGTIVGTSDTQTLTNKTVGSAGVGFAGSTSGTTTVAASATASGTLTLPAATATLTYTVASGTAALGTTAIASGACATAVTVSATGVVTTDVIQTGFNGDPTAVTGYAPSTSGMLTVIPYPTANNVNFKVCNDTSASITPGAITLNWRVAR